MRGLASGDATFYNTLTNRETSGRRITLTLYRGGTVGLLEEGGVPTPRELSTGSRPTESPEGDRRDRRGKRLNDEKSYCGPH